MSDEYNADTPDWCDEHTVTRDNCLCPYPGTVAGARLNTAPAEVEANARHLVLTRASTITPARVQWLYDGRLALGTLGLLAGREGQGKSTVAAWIVARITRGELPGCYLNEPRAVIICATEDSWAHTIVPRLMAADADLDLIYRVDVVTSIGTGGNLNLPMDIPALQTTAVEVGAALIVLDPLTSRLSGTLDTHKDAETRQALEPLVAMADAAGLAVLGIIHFNKGTTSDPMTSVMGSRAFTAVARSVHTVVPDPDDDARRFYATPKNNLGRDDLPMLGFTIAGHAIDTPTGTAWTSRIIWGEEVHGNVADIMQRTAQGGDRSAAVEAADWLADYLESEGGRLESATIKREGIKAGHSIDSLKRARQRLKLTTESVGFPRRTYWASLSQSEQQSEQVGGDSILAPTAPTVLRGDLLDINTTTETQSVQLEQLEQSDSPPLTVLPLSNGVAVAAELLGAVVIDQPDISLMAW